MKSNRETTSSEPGLYADQLADLMRNVASLVERPQSVTIGAFAKLVDRLRGEFAMTEAFMQRQLLPGTADDSDFAFLDEEAGIEPLAAEQIAALAGYL